MWPDVAPGQDSFHTPKPIKKGGELGSIKAKVFLCCAVFLFSSALCSALSFFIFSWQRFLQPRYQYSVVVLMCILSPPTHTSSDTQSYLHHHWTLSVAVPVSVRPVTHYQLIAFCRFPPNMSMWNSTFLPALTEPGVRRMHFNLFFFKPLATSRNSLC